MTSRSELRRLAVQAGEPAPEFPLEHAGENGHHPLSPAAAPVAPSAAPEGATGHDAREEVPPSSLAPAPQSVPPSLTGAARPSSDSLSPEGGLASSPAGGARPDDASPAGSTPLAGPEFRKAWKRAQSERNAGARRKRGGPRQQPGYRPGGNRRGGEAT